MRIGIFSNCYQPMVNGVVGVVNLLRQGFLETGHQVHLFVPGFDDYQDNDPTIHRYPAVDLTNQIKYPVAIPWAPGINKILRQLQLDLIHVHHPFVLGPVALQWARRKRIPIVYTFHTQYEQYSHYIPLPGSLVRLLTRHQVRRFCQAVDGLTTPAESARSILAGYRVTRPVTVIPNPINLAEFNQADRELVRRKYNLNREGLLINIGRLAPEKDLPLLLHSFKALLDQASGRPLKLMVVGDGSERPALEALAEQLGIAPAVIFTGLVEPRLVPSYLAAADLFVMTSVSEVKPLAQLEALAAGLPLVAVAATGANDTIVNGENGLLVNASAVELAQAIGGLLAEPGRLARMQSAALKTAARYDYPRITAEYLALFETIIAAWRMR